MDYGEHLPPGAKFYLATEVNNADDTVDLDIEGRVGDDLEEMTQHVVETIGGETGMETYIYECRAIRRIVRGKVRVIDLKSK